MMVLGMASVAVWLPNVPAAEAATTTVTPTAGGPPPGMVGPMVVNNGPGDQVTGAISGTLVSYTDFSGPTAQIRYHDVAADTDAAIPNNGAFDVTSEVYGSTVVYTEASGANQTIYSFNTATPGQAPQALDPQPSALRENPSIGAVTVAWEDFGFDPQNQVSEIVVYDRASDVTTRLTNDTLADTNPAVSPSGSVVAWTKCASPGAGCAIYEASLAGGTWSVPQRLTDPTLGDCEFPHTNGGVVAYDCSRAGQQSIFWQPVVGGSENQLVLSGDSRNAHISGSLISFERRGPTPNWNLYAYSLANNTLYQITNTSDDNILSDISVGTDGVARMVWSVQEATNGYNVYAVSFPEPSSNRPPDCSHVSLDTTLLWPANNRFVPVTASGATDPDGGTVSTRVDGMTQDEPTAGLYNGDGGPDGQLSSPPSATAQVRAERSDAGDGRVYHLHVTATDSAGLSCTADRTVGVPHDRGARATPIDSAPPSYNSLQ